MDRATKEAIANGLREELGGAASVLLGDLTGIDVDTINMLRAQLRARGVTCRVAKNTLIKRAIADTDMEIIGPMLAGPTALFWHNEEPSVAAKVIKDFRKELKKKELIEFKGAYIDGELIEGAKAMSLAEIPSKDELRAQMLGLVKAVPGKFLALVETAPRKFLGVIEARRQKLEDEAA
jgi:large subunit ribosomal protein L10